MDDGRLGVDRRRKAFPQPPGNEAREPDLGEDRDADPSGGQEGRNEEEASGKPGGYRLEASAALAGSLEAQRANSIQRLALAQARFS